MLERLKSQDTEHEIPDLHTKKNVSELDFNHEVLYTRKNFIYLFIEMQQKH